MVRVERLLLVVGITATVFLSLFFVGVHVKNECEDLSFNITALNIDSLCNYTNSYETTFEIVSKCPASIKVNSLSLLFSFSSTGMIQTSLPAFTLSSGKNIIQASSLFSLIGDSPKESLKTILEEVTNGTSVDVTATATISGSVFGYSFQDIEYAREIGCINGNCSASSENETNIDNNNNKRGISKHMKISSVESHGTVNDHFFASKFTVKLISIPIPNLIINIPTVNLQLYEAKSYIGDVTIHQIQFGNGTFSLLPLSTILSQDQIARIVKKTLQQTSGVAAIDIFGSPSSLSSLFTSGEDSNNNNNGQCVVNELISGVKLASVPLPMKNLEQLSESLGVPSVDIGKLVTKGTATFSLPLSLDVHFTRFTLPNMVFAASALPSNIPIANLELNGFSLTPSLLSFQLVFTTVNIRLLHNYTNALVDKEIFPVDVKWVVGSRTIFEVMDYDLQIDFHGLADAAKRWYRGSGFSVSTDIYSTTPGRGRESYYSASLIVHINGFYRPNPTIFDTGRIPLYYLNQPFGGGVIKASYDGDITLTAGIYLPDPPTVLKEIWNDLQHNRLPPGIVLMGVGNKNILVKDVFNNILHYFGHEHLDFDSTIHLDSIAHVDLWKTGRGHNSAFMNTELAFHEGIVKALQLNKLSIRINTGNIGVSLQDGTAIGATLETYFRSPLLVANFNIKWDHNPPTLPPTAGTTTASGPSSSASGPITNTFMYLVLAFVLAVMY